MEAVYLAALAAVLMLHGLALTLISERLRVGPATSLAVAIVATVTVLFALEHAVGLGSLRWLGGLTTAASAWMVYRARDRLCTVRALTAAAPLLVAVLWGLLWRGNFPSFYPSSERITDLYFIGNYLAGEQLPPMDHWLAPYRFDFYYSFQHYGAALLARLFGTGPGLTYHVAFVILMGLTVAIAWELARRQGLGRSAALLLVAALAVGGTGASMWTRVIAVNTEAEPANVNTLDRMAASARLIGNFDQRINTPVGEAVFASAIAPARQRMELPMENLGYQFYIGDYHPPLSGFLLLALALAVLWGAQGAVGARRALLLGIAAATVPLTLAANTWVFPLQVVLVGTWALWAAWHARSDRLAAEIVTPMVLGAGATLVLLMPFLAGFTARSEEGSFAWVREGQHTPLVSFVILHGPMLVLLALAPWAAPRLRGFVWPVALALAGCLALSELIYMDDPTGGAHERTNTTMKWWGWIWTGTLIGVAPAILGSRHRWVRGAAIAALASTLAYGIDIVDFVRHEARTDRWQLHGEAVYRREAGGEAIIRYLRQAPRGVVLERQVQFAYSDAGAYSALAGQPLFLGWPLHQVTWRGQLHEIWQRRDRHLEIYEGRHPDPVGYLRAHGVRYVVWSVREAMDAGLRWDQVNSALAGAYQWKELGQVDGRPVGVFIFTYENN